MFHLTFRFPNPSEDWMNCSMSHHFFVRFRSRKIGAPPAIRPNILLSVWLNALNAEFQFLILLKRSNGERDVEVLDKRSAIQGPLEGDMLVFGK